MNDKTNEYHYFDYAATAPMCKEAACVMQKFLSADVSPDNFYNANANSLHTPGRSAFGAMESARRNISRALGAGRPSEIIFTSGATEADNSAIFGIARALCEAKGAGGRASTSIGAINEGNDETQNPSTTPTIFVSAIEHEAVLQPALTLKREGWRVQLLQPNKHGFITPEALDGAIKRENLAPGTPLLVSVMMANSEIGAVQDIQALANVAHAHRAIFHTDAVQALGKVPLNLKSLGVDAASFSAHKIGGLKGIGCLYLKARTPYSPFMLGGGQENGLRSGTQNLCGILSFEAALCACVEAQNAQHTHLSELRDYLYDELSAIDGVVCTTPNPKSSDYLPNIVHVCVSGLDSETIVLQMDARGFAISGGSACSSHSTETSHVLRAIGIENTLARGAVRISLGAPTTRAQVELLLQAFREVVAGV